MSKFFFDFTVKGSDSKNYNLTQHSGKVVLVVNVASQCGFTPQYKGLEELYQLFSHDQFTILGFPCNQFGSQEPASDSEIQQFCSLTYNVTFPVLAKIDVNGSGADPVFQFLKAEAPGLLGTETVKWNFTKFLVGKNGKVIRRYAPTVEPTEIIEDIKKAINTDLK